MKKIILILIIILSNNFAFNQRHELGIMLGAPNLIADIGKTSYIQPLPSSTNLEYLSYSFGLLYKYNLNPRQSLRLNLNFNHVNFDDKLAKEDYRFARGKKGKNDIIEGSIVFEYNFFDINDEMKFGMSPYIFGGAGAFLYYDRKYTISHQLNTNPDGSIKIPTSATDFNTTVDHENEYKSALVIPFGVGYKIKFNYNWVLSAEIGVRFTNTDRLDYSISQSDQYTSLVDPNLESLSTIYDIPIEIQKRNNAILTSNQTGNVTSKDWYVISALNLTYAFGRPPCFCE